MERWKTGVAGGILMLSVIVGGCRPSENPHAPSMPLEAEATARIFMAAARRGDQETFDALIDHQRMTQSFQANSDKYTGHGAFRALPDAKCREYRPLSERIFVDPEMRLRAEEIATLMTEVKTPMSVRRVGPEKFSLDFSLTITGFSFVLEKVSGQWRITTYSPPDELPIPPQFVCAKPLKATV